MSNNYVLDNFEWSFSRIESFNTCPYAFYLSYIKELKGAESFFGQYGSFLHNLLDKYNNGKLFDFQLIDEYERNYSDFVSELVSESISNNYYNQGYAYFENFTPKYNIICAEQRYKFKIDEYNFNGVIDAETDTNAILDYKTKKSQTYKRMPKDKVIRTLTDGRFVELNLFKQLYIYCIPYYNKHGKYPDELILDMIRINDIYILPFNIDDFNFCKQQTLDDIKKIYETLEFSKTESDFWCNQICGQRFNCKIIEGENK